jgi:hypothetical protein
MHASLVPVAAKLAASYADYAADRARTARALARFARVNHDARARAIRAARDAIAASRKARRYLDMIG